MVQFAATPFSARQHQPKVLYGFYTETIPTSYKDSHGLSYVRHGAGYVAVNAHELAAAGAGVKVQPYRGHR